MITKKPVTVDSLTYVTLACLYGLETVALTENNNNRSFKVARRPGPRELQEQRGWMGDERPEGRTVRMGRTVGSWMMWAGHLVQMEERRLPKRAEVMKHTGRKEVRPQLKWE